MARTVTFIDTSILTEILAVPGKSQQPEAVQNELRQRVDDGEMLVLPTAAIIETGNHIGQLPDGGQRRQCAERLDRFLRAIADDQAPWTLHGSAWDADFLRRLCDGDGRRPSLVDLATQRVGVGDVSILGEVDAYRARVARSVAVGVWTTDAGLEAYA